jgi:hypothetical protein
MRNCASQNLDIPDRRSAASGMMHERIRERHIAKKKGPPKRAFELQLADDRDQAVLV